MNRLFRPSILFAFALLSFIRTASAQDTGFAINRFDRAEVGSDWFAGESLDLRGHVRPAVGLAIDYASEPLVLYLANDEQYQSIRFYFSFRSPYAWLAAERLEAELGDLGLAIELIPIYPTAEYFPPTLVHSPEKVAYIVQDIARLTRERGLSVRFPTLFDPDWSLSHAAFLGARDLGAGRPFMLEMYRKRFSEGLDLGEDGVIADAARRARLDADAIVSAAHSDELRAEVAAGWRRGVERDKIFGVPSFVYAGKLYWGQDRMHFVRSAVIRKSGAAS